MFAVLAGSAAGQGLPPSSGDMPDMPRSVANEDLRKREPSLFRRPTCATPAAQLAYAKSLLGAGETRAASRAFLALVHQWHESPEAAAAQLEYATLLYDSARYEKAFSELQYLVDYFHGRFPFEKVTDMQFRIANHIRTRQHGGFLFIPTFQAPERSLPLYEQYVRNAPSGAHTAEARFAMAMIREEEKDYGEAAADYEAILRLPRSDFTSDAAFRRARCYHRIALASPRDELAARTALDALASFLRGYPGHPNETEARAAHEDLRDRLADMYYGRAAFYDRKGDKPRAALLAYTDFVRNFPSSPQSDTARARIAELETLVKEAE